MHWPRDDTGLRARARREAKHRQRVESSTNQSQNKLDPTNCSISLLNDEHSLNKMTYMMIMWIPRPVVLCKCEVASLRTGAALQLKQSMPEAPARNLLGVLSSKRQKKTIRGFVALLR